MRSPSHFAARCSDWGEWIPRNGHKDGAGYSGRLLHRRQQVWPVGKVLDQTFPQCRIPISSAAVKSVVWHARRLAESVPHSLGVSTCGVAHSSGPKRPAVSPARARGPGSSVPEIPSKGQRPGRLFGQNRIACATASAGRRRSSSRGSIAWRHLWLPDTIPIRLPNGRAVGPQDQSLVAFSPRPAVWAGKMSGRFGPPETARQLIVKQVLPAPCRRTSTRRERPSRVVWHAQTPWDGRGPRALVASTNHALRRASWRATRPIESRGLTVPSRHRGAGEQDRNDREERPGSRPRDIRVFSP